MRFASSLRGLNLVESAGIGATSTFMPLFANNLTHSYIVVGSIIAGYGLAQAISYAYFAKMYDKKGPSSKIFLIRLGYLLCTAAFLLHAVAFDGLSLLAIRVFTGIATGIYAGGLIAKSYEAAGKKLALAGIISFGSLGWLVGSISGGALKQAFGGDMSIVFALSGAMFFMGFILSLRMKSENKQPADSAKPADMRTTAELLRQNKTVYSAFFLRHMGASAAWSMFPIFLAKELGAADIWIGVIYATNSLTQFIFMNKFGAFTQINYYRSIQLGAGLSAVVFVAYYASQTFFHAFPIQVLLGVSWSLLYVGSLLFLLDRNKEKATSSALLESAMSVGAIIGPLAGGLIAEMFGVRNVLFFSFVMTAGSFALSKTLKRQTMVVQQPTG